MESIADPAEIRRLVEAFRVSIANTYPVLHPGMTTRLWGRRDVYFNPDFQLWATSFEMHGTPENREANLFGLGDPQTTRLDPMAVELNFLPSRRISDRRTARGLFLKGTGESIYIARRGGLKDVRGSQLYERVRQQLGRDRIVTVQMPDGRPAEVILACELGAYNQLEQLYNFVSVCANLKGLAVPGPRRGAHAVREIGGHITIAPRTQTIEYDRRHNLISDALFQELSVHGEPRREIDLWDMDYTRARNYCLFEIKSGSTTTEVYQCIGQLYSYAERLFRQTGRRPRKVAVLPSSVDQTTREILSAIGIEVVTHVLDGDTYRFNDLDLVI